MDLTKLDKRLLERHLRQRAVSPEETLKAWQQLPDSAANAHEYSEEELEKVGQALESEREIRRGRIKRAVELYPRRADFEGDTERAALPEPLDELEI